MGFLGTYLETKCLPNGTPVVQGKVMLPVSALFVHDTKNSKHMAAKVDLSAKRLVVPGCSRRNTTDCVEWLPAATRDLARGG